ncbi:reverse transcriptase domain-containing protein [Tanacetum coccineum]
MPASRFTELHQIDTFYNSLTSTDQDSLYAAAGGNLLTKTPKDALCLIRNKSKVRTSRNRLVVAKVSTNTSTSGLSPDVAALIDAVKALLIKNTTPHPAFVKAVEESCVTCGGPHPYYQCLDTDGNASGYQDNIQAYVFATEVYYYQGNARHRPPSVAHQVRPPGFPPVQNNQNRGNNYNPGNSTYRAPTPPTQAAPSNELANYMNVNETNMRAMQNQITNMKAELKNEFQATMLQQNNKLENLLSNYFQMNKPPSSGPLPRNTITNPKDVQPQAPTSKPVITPKPKPDLPYPSRLNNQNLRERVDHQMMKFLQIFRSLHFDLSFTDALLYMPKFASTFKNLLSNKEKLFELANTSMNENCSVVILKKLPKKLGDPGKFLIPCNFPEIIECLALADLGKSINLMPLSIWRKLSLPELTPTQMILELVDRSTTRPTGIAEDVFVRVGKMERALIDVYGEELTLRVSDEAITFKVGNTSRYSYNDVESINRIDVIDIACEDYSQEVFGFSDNSESGNPIPISELIIAKTSPSLTPFEGGDFILEEIETYLASDPVPSGMDDAEFDPEGDIRLIEEMLNNDPYSPLPPKDLKCEELKSVKSSVDEPPELELKDLPSHLEYEFLEGTDKLPVIIAKNLKDDEKERLIKVSPVHCVMTVVTNEDNELIPTRLVTGWRVCIDYRKLNDAPLKDHFPLPFMDQMLERLAGNEYYCFLDGFSRCMMAIFHDMIEETMEVFMDDFSVFEDSFSSCLSHLDKMLNVRRHQSCSKLGEVPLHGQGGHCPRPKDFEIWD